MTIRAFFQSFESPNDETSRKFLPVTSSNFPFGSGKADFECPVGTARWGELNLSSESSFGRRRGFFKKFYSIFNKDSLLNKVYWQLLMHV